ncbi:hypothetical protein [Aquimarina addita]
MLILFVSMISCDDSIQKEISFYHWKTNFALNEEERSILKNVNASKLYIKFFDVSWVAEDNRAYPKATIQFTETDMTGIQDIVPVIFITNNVFEKVNTPEDIKHLSSNVSEKIKRIYATHLNGQFSIKEIQFDCDWTVGTKEAYFDFINQIKASKAFMELKNPLITATIRLHQIKYKNKTGVPPVDRGVIMFYNTGTVFKLEEQNSILSVAEVEKYIDTLGEYPLVYDVAFPTFSWAVVFRNNSFLGLINDVTEKDLMQNFTSKNGFYEPNQATFLKTTFLSEGDKIRLEQPSEKDLEMLAKKVRDASSQETYKVIYYHINSELVTLLGSDSLNKIAK